MNRAFLLSLAFMAPCLTACRQESTTPAEFLRPSRATPPATVEYRDAERCAREWGLRLCYVPGSERATFSDNARDLICGPGMKSALIDGASLRLPAPVELRHGQLMLPMPLVIAAEKAWAGRPRTESPEPKASPVAEPVRAPRYRIVVDAGHGGCLTGAQGSSGTWEKTVNLSIARQLKELLTDRGAEVVLLRDGDCAFFQPALASASYHEQQKADLTERVRLANLARPDLFVSIHANWAPSADAEGFEVYYPRPASVPPPPLPSRRTRRRPFDWSAYGADTGRVLNRLANADGEEARERESRSLAESVRCALKGALSCPDRGARPADFKVIRGSCAPAILVETGFLSSPNEERRLGTPAYQKRVAEALADGIERFIASRR